MTVGKVHKYRPWLFAGQQPWNLRVETEDCAIILRLAAGLGPRGISFIHALLAMAADQTSARPWRGGGESRCAYHGAGYSRQCALLMNRRARRDGNHGGGSSNRFQLVGGTLAGASRWVGVRAPAFGRARDTRPRPGLQPPGMEEAPPQCINQCTRSQPRRSGQRGSPCPRVCPPRQPHHLSAASRFAVRNTLPAPQRQQQQQAAATATVAEVTKKVAKLNHGCL